MEKIDRRVQRTRSLISDTFLNLLMIKNYSEISVQEITDAANLGRATFYLHYRSKDECLRQLLTDAFDSLVAEIEKTTDKKDDFVTSVEKIFVYIFRNRRLYLALLGDPLGGNILMDVRNYIKANMMEIVTEQSDCIRPVLNEAIAAYLAGAQLNMLLWWLQKEPDMTTREAAVLFADISLNGVNHYQQLILQSLNVDK